MKRITKFLLIPAGVTSAVCLAAGWLIFTDSGQETLIRTALPHVPGLQVEAADGGLRDLTLKGLRWEMPGAAVSAERIHLGFDWRALFNQHLRFTDLTLEGVSIAVNTAELPTSGEPEAPSEPLRDLRAPLPLTVENISLSRIDAQMDGIRTSLVSFASSLAWRNRLVSVGGTRLRGLTVALPPAPEPTAEEASRPAEPLGRTLEALFQKPLLPELPDIIVPVDADIAGFEAEDLRLEGASPAAVSRASLSALLKNGSLTLRELTADLPEVSASLSGTAELSGSRELDLKGRAELREAPLSGESADFSLRGPLSGRLAFYAGLKGPVAADIRLEAEPSSPNLPLRLHVTADELAWPPAPAESEEPVRLQALSLTLDGTARNYLLGLQTGLQVSGAASAGIRLDGRGSLTAFHLNEGRVRAAGGEARLKADFGWADDITAAGSVTLSSLALKHFVPALDAVLSGGTDFSARLSEGNWSADLKALTLRGTLGSYALEAEGSLAARSPMLFSAPGLSVRLGGNRIDAKGSFDGKALAADLLIDAPDLPALLPGLAGRLEGRLTASGTAEAPAIDADLKGSGLGWDGMTLETLSLAGRAAADPKGLTEGDLTLKLSGGELPGFRLRTLTAHLAGTETAHRLRLDADGDPASAGLTLEGGFSREKMTWDGRLAEGSADTPAGHLAQDGPASLVVNAGTLSGSLSEHCWRHQSAEVCLEKPLTARDGGQTGSAALALRRFDLAFLKPWLPKGTAVSGRFEGRADAVWRLAESSLPVLALRLDGHDVAVRQTVGEASLPLEFTELGLSAGMKGSRLSADLTAALRDNGSLSAALAVTDPQGAKSLDARLRISDIDLSALNALITSGEKAEGILSADLTAGGSLADPSLSGRLSLESVRVSEGMVPLEMKPSRIDVDFSGRQSRLTGAVDTAQGRLDVTGSADWRDLDKWLAEVSAKGNRILVTVPPMARVWVSPDVTLRADPTLITLSGRVDIPKARIEVTELPESAVSISDDEVMLDAALKPIEPKTPSVPISSTLTIGIGKDVRLSAFGLKAALSGDLEVKQDRRGLGLNGLISVDSGRFHAYGQDLQVRKGQIVFAGPADQPLLHLEAIRNPDAVEDNVIAGIRVTGVAARPKLVVFSEPAMSQQEALSYLVRGQGLGKDTDSGSALTSALIGLGVSQTGSVVSKIGSAVGIQDLGVDTEGVGDSSQVVVSGYVLPGLQVKYGVGIFDSLATLTLRYRLMPKLYLEAVSGVNQVVDLLYRFEY
ncbi:MAG: translocation/assembly module TamB [Sutterella sp.]|nr:translocation/assembly module TamB [Sutterella sp.]